MADNVVADSGSGGATFAADDIGGVHYPRVKLISGADGTNDGDVASGNPLPVDIIAALPAGTAAIGKLAANSGVDIGDVDVTSQIPGTAATNLGKAVDTAVGATDTGVAMLAKHAAASARLSTAELDYDIPRLSEFGALLTEPEQHLVIDDMNALLGGGGTWAAINDDTTGVGVSTKHVLGTKSVEFDKVAGTANSQIGGVTKALTAINLDGASPHDILQCVTYVGATTELDDGSSYMFLRLGTNSTDYNEWRIPGTAFTAGEWETVAMEIGDASHVGQGGAGITWAAITYIAVGFFFDDIDDTLANILVDEISYHTNQHVNAAINAEITSSVSSANINLHKVAGSPATKGAGNVGNGTQRVTIATDDVNQSGILTAVELIDDAIFVDDTATHATGTTKGMGIMAVAVPTDSAISANDIGMPAMSLDRRLHVDADITASVALDVSAAAVVLGAGTAEFGKLAAGTAAIGKLAANSGVDIGDVDVTSLPGAKGTGGSKVFHNADLNTDVEITDTATSTVYWIHCMNITGALAYLSFWDADSADIALGTDPATYQFIIPTQGDTNGAGFTITFGQHGIAHTTGLSIGAATTATGSTDPNGVSVTVGYQD